MAPLSPVRGSAPTAPRGELDPDGELGEPEPDEPEPDEPVLMVPALNNLSTTISCIKKTNLRGGTGSCSRASRGGRGGRGSRRS